MTNFEIASSVIRGVLWFAGVCRHSMKSPLLSECVVRNTLPDCSDTKFPELETNLLPRRTAMELDGAEGAPCVS